VRVARFQAASMRSICRCAPTRLLLKQPLGLHEVGCDLLPCLISRPLPGPCPAARLRPTALPIAAKTAIGSPLAETVGSSGRTAHSWAADCISCGQPRTIPGARSRDMSSSASRANPSLSSRELSDLRASRRRRCSAPTPGPPPWPEDHQQRPRPLSVRTS
jgi:hypothetical protein